MDTKKIQKTFINFDWFKAAKGRCQLVVQTWTNASNMELIQDGGRTMDTMRLDCWVVGVFLTTSQGIRPAELDEGNLCRKDGSARLRAG